MCCVLSGYFLLDDKLGGAILYSQAVPLFAEAFPHHLALFCCYGSQLRQVLLLNSQLSKASGRREDWTQQSISPFHACGPTGHCPPPMSSFCVLTLLLLHPSPASFS